MKYLTKLPLLGSVLSFMNKEASPKFGYLSVIIGLLCFSVFLTYNNYLNIQENKSLARENKIYLKQIENANKEANQLRTNIYNLQLETKQLLSREDSINSDYDVVTKKLREILKNGANTCSTVVIPSDLIKLLQQSSSIKKP